MTGEAMRDNLRNWSRGYGPDWGRHDSLDVMSIPGLLEVTDDGQAPEYKAKVTVQLTGGSIPEGGHMTVEYFELALTRQSPMVQTLKHNYDADYPWVDPHLILEFQDVPMVVNDEGEIFKITYNDGSGGDQSDD